MSKSRNYQKRRLAKELEEENLTDEEESRVYTRAGRRKRAEAALPPKGRTKKARTNDGGVDGRTMSRVESPRGLDGTEKNSLVSVADSKLWAYKYAPLSEKDLAVHSKKVAEVKDWIEQEMRYPSQSQSHVLLLTGPAGVGKTAVVHVLAKALNVEILEWVTPVPTLWHEYSHHAGTGASYGSKMDDFEAFIEKARKFLPLPNAAVGSSSQAQHPLNGLARLNLSEGRSKILLIDDLPNAHNKVHSERLCHCLRAVAACSKFPAIVIISDEVGSGQQMDNRRVQTNELIMAMEAVGVKKIAFNPITTNSLMKVLKRVQAAENTRVSLRSLSAIAENCAGDIRQALTALQFMCLDNNSDGSRSLARNPGGHDPKRSVIKRMKPRPEGHSDASHQPTLGDRDPSLSLFHALGKFLHNKRHKEMPLQLSLGDENSTVKEELCRTPLKLAEPEEVLTQAHGETSTVAAFLHENVLQFVDEEAIEDVSAILSCLSDTDCMLGGGGSNHYKRAALNFQEIEPSQIANAAASSVAARGVLFWNAHPAPSRWHSLRAPCLWQVERQQSAKRVETFLATVTGNLSGTYVTGSVLISEILPYRHRLNVPSPSAAVITEDCKNLSAEIPDTNEDEMDISTSDEMSSRGPCTYVLGQTLEQEDIEDEIEDW